MSIILTVFAPLSAGLSILTLVLMLSLMASITTALITLSTVARCPRLDARVSRAAD